MEFSTKRTKKTIGLQITSLVDVLFIILIFVLVSTTFLEQPALDIELPEAKASNLYKVHELIISISQNGQIYINDIATGKQNLNKLLEQYLNENNKDVSVVLKADKTVDYGLVIEVMDIMKSVGVKKLVALTTLPKGSRQ